MSIYVYKGLESPYIQIMANAIDDELFSVKLLSSNNVGDLQVGEMLCRKWVYWTVLEIESHDRDSEWVNVKLARNGNAEASVWDGARASESVSVLGVMSS